MTPTPNTETDRGATDSGTGGGADLTRRRLLGGAAAVGTAGLAGCLDTFIQIETTSTTLERQFDADTVSRLRVVDATDAVVVDTTDADAVQVRAHKRAHGQTELGDLAFETTVADDRLTVTTEKPNVVGIGGGSVDLELSVPDRVTVERVATRDGDVKLQGVSGTPAVETSDGDIRLRNVSGNATAETEDGDVIATDAAGDLDAATRDGDVTIERVRGTVSARSSDGSVTVRDPDALGDVRTDDGDVDVDAPAIDGTVEVRSRDGNVTVSLGAALDATVDATTDDGRITVAGGLDSVESVGETHATGTVGDGTNQLQVRTNDGDVTLAPLE